ncbi:MAG: type IV pili methyl-accepting chemotaxis transducer N-terminal domain-containing protein, partial [Casimicrobiaceae bacterium]
MALRMPRLFGADAPPAENIDFDPPTTQVRMIASSTETYDPLASMSVMEQLRVAANAAPVPPKLPIIGNLPVVRQFQLLGALTLLFVALAAFMLFLDSRATSQQALRVSTATEMQMLSQRLARGAALAAQGQANAFAAVRDSRERFRTDLDALVNGGAFKGVV